jgi:hypothetical protein
MACGDERRKYRFNRRMGRYVYLELEENIKMDHKEICVQVSSGLDTLIPV